MKRSPLSKKNKQSSSTYHVVMVIKKVQYGAIIFHVLARSGAQTSSCTLPTCSPPCSDVMSVASSSQAGPTSSAHQSASLSYPTTPTAPYIETPSAFGLVAPGVYRCSASSLVQGLPPAPRGWSPREAPRNDFKDASTGTSGAAWGASQTHMSSTPVLQSPTDAFLTSLQLRTVLLITPEKKPLPLAAWCDTKCVDLIHLGLGALADSWGKTHQPASREALGCNGSPRGNSKAIPSSNINKISEANQPDTFHDQSTWDYSSATRRDGMTSLERIVKDSLEVILDATRLPCLICDMWVKVLINFQVADFSTGVV